MAETRREIHSIGQPIIGLLAGEEYTFVLKKPPPRIDVENARRSARAAQSTLDAAERAAGELARAQYFALAGDPDSADEAKEQAEQSFRIFQRGLTDASELADRAAQDARVAPGEVRDAYEAARDGAALGPKFIDAAREPFEEALQAIGALIEQARASQEGTGSHGTR